MPQTSLLVADDDASAQDVLHDSLCTDGFPVVLPTNERVARLVLASGYDADLVIGRVPPRGGLATVEVVAANALMAGCTPDHMPVVLAVVRAALDENLDMPEMQSTTNPVSPFIIVNGPARVLCGIASGHGALGPGHRANATIGRALRLLLINAGGARPGEGDMTLLGHGSKFSACLGEAEEESPFDPFHVSRGWESTDSVVTVVGADAPQAIVFLPTDNYEQSADMLLDLIAGVLSNPAHVGTYSADGSDVVVLNPDHAHVLHCAGLDRVGIVAELSRRATISIGRLRSLNPSVMHMVASYRDHPDAAVVCTTREEGLILLVAGGNGAYSWTMRSWGVGPHRGMAAMRQVQLDQACDVIVGPDEQV